MTPITESEAREFIADKAGLKWSHEREIWWHPNHSFDRYQPPDFFGEDGPECDREALFWMREAVATIWNDPSLSAAYCLALDKICQPNRESVLDVIGAGYTGWIAHASSNQQGRAFLEVHGYKLKETK